MVWDANGGTLSGEYTYGNIAYGSEIIAPIATYAGYVFAGWDITVPATMPDDDLILTAKWEKALTTAIEQIDGTVIGNKDVRIYDFNGRDVTGLNGKLGSGLYIVVSGDKVAKIVIR